MAKITDAQKACAMDKLSQLVKNGWKLRISHRETLGEFVGSTKEVWQVSVFGVSGTLAWYDSLEEAIVAASLCVERYTSTDIF